MSMVYKCACGRILNVLTMIRDAEETDWDPYLDARAGYVAREFAFLCECERWIKIELSEPITSVRFETEEDQTTVEWESD